MPLEDRLLHKHVVLPLVLKKLILLVNWLTWFDSDIYKTFTKGIFTRNCHFEGVKSHRQLRHTQNKSSYVMKHTDATHTQSANHVVNIEKSGYLKLRVPSINLYIRNTVYCLEVRNTKPTLRNFYSILENYEGALKKMACFWRSVKELVIHASEENSQ